MDAFYLYKAMEAQSLRPLDTLDKIFLIQVLLPSTRYAIRTHPSYDEDFDEEALAK